MNHIGLALLATVSCATLVWGQVITPETLGKAPTLDVKNVCIPVQTMRQQNAVLVPNPDKKTYDLLMFYKYSKEPTQVFIVDLSTNQMKKELLKPGYSNPWGMAFSRDGRLFMGLWSGSAMLVYDPATNTLTDMPKVVDDSATESVVCGTDGKIYVGTFSKVMAFQVDPETMKVTQYGIQGPKRNYMGYAYSIAADDEYVYTASGKIPWVLVGYNKKTGQQEGLVQGSGEDHISVRQGKYGCTGSFSINTGPEKGTRKDYWLYKGKAIEKKSAQEKPPWPEPEEKAAPAAGPAPELFVEGATPGPDGVAEIWYRTAEAARGAALPKDLPKGATSEQQGWKVIKPKVDVVPIGINRLTEMPDGRLFGTVDSYQGHFIYDPAKNECTYLGRIGLSHYGTAFAGGRVYLTGYPSSPIYEYDPTKPWTPGHGAPGRPAPAEQAKDSNPRLLLRMATLISTHHLEYAVTGADGKIYAGGHCERAAVGGGFGWWDPKEQKAGGLREPFLVYDVSWLCAAQQGKKIVYSSVTIKDPSGKTPEPEQAKLFVFDVEQGKIVKEIEPLKGLKNTGRIVEGKPGKILGAAPDPRNADASLLYQVDLESGQVDFVRDVPTKFRGDFRKGPDGAIWTFLGNVLIRIIPETAEIVLIGNAQAPGRIAFSGGDVYLAGDVNLRKIAGVIRAK
jgi:hypothetical protein